MGNDLQRFLNGEKLDFRPQLLLKLMGAWNEGPIFFVGQKEIPPLMKLSMGFLSMDFHPFIKLLVKTNTVLRDTNIYFCAKLFPDAPRTQGGRRKFIGRIFFKNSNSTWESVIG